MSREWYRFFLSLFRLTGDGSNATSLTDLQLGPPVRDSSGELIEVYDQAHLAAMTPSVSQSQIDELTKVIEALQIAPAVTPHFDRKAFGVFSDSTTQTAAATGTAYAVKFNTTDNSHGVTIGSPTSRIYVDRIGTYDFQFSMQLNKASASAKNVWVWYRINGVDVANSATKVTLAGSSSATVAAWNFVDELNANDYFELMWSTDDTGCIIEAAAAAAPVPAIPSVILTVTDNITT
jgi:hypothetical protein